jgi:hypothetical protein
MMSSDQYQRALARLDLSIARAAVLLDVDRRTSERWASGDRDVPGPVGRFLTYLLSTGKSGESVIKKLETKK